MVTQVLHRLARSLHHVAFQLIAVLRRLSDVLQGRVRHTSPKETNASPCELSSYRPISNLSFLSKLLEHVVSVQLTGDLSSAGLLSVHPLAYWRFHSTDSTLPKVVTDITEAIDAGDHALLGLLNLSAAFDTMDHDVLAEHLSRTYRIRSTALDWLRSYLCDRRQTILYGGGLLNLRPLRLLRSCIKLLPFRAAKAAVTAFVTSRVDRCNSLLAGAPPGRTPVGAQCHRKAHL